MSRANREADTPRSCESNSLDDILLARRLDRSEVRLFRVSPRLRRVSFKLFMLTGRSYSVKRKFELSYSSDDGKAIAAFGESFGPSLDWSSSFCASSSDNWGVTLPMALFVSISCDENFQGGLCPVRSSNADSFTWTSPSSDHPKVSSPPFNHTRSYIHPAHRAPSLVVFNKSPGLVCLDLAFPPRWCS